MRKTIGNITIYKPQQIESDAKREELRQNLLQSRISKAMQTEARKNLLEMSGRKDITESILYLFDVEGRPPAHITIDTIKAQYNNMYSQFRWVEALIEEINGKLQEIDPERFAKDQAEIEDKENKKVEVRRQAHLRYLEQDKQNIPPKAYELLLEAVQNSNYAKKLRLELDHDPMSLSISGPRTIEKMLRYLFADYITNPAQKVDATIEERYDVLTRERNILSVLSAEVERKLYHLREVADSTKEYLQQNN